MENKKMSKSEMYKREKIVKGMKKSDGKDFEKRYPGRGKEVMYATATKQAMKESYKDLFKRQLIESLLSEVSVSSPTLPIPVPGLDEIPGSPFGTPRPPLTYPRPNMPRPQPRPQTRSAPPGPIRPTPGPNPINPNPTPGPRKPFSPRPIIPKPRPT